MKKTRIIFMTFLLLCMILAFWPVPVGAERPQAGFLPDERSIADLEVLTASNVGTLNPLFDPAETEYRVNVAYDIDTIEVTATLSSAKALLTIDDEPVTSGVAKTVTLEAVGTTTHINIVVTAEDGITDKTYIIAVRRSAAPLEWYRLTTSTAEALSYGDMTGNKNKNFVAAFSSGTWYIEDDQWVRFTPSKSRARTITFADMTGDGYKNFVAGMTGPNGSGTWYIKDGQNWVSLTASTAEALGYGDMTGNGIDNLVLSAPSGIWYIDSGVWNKVTTSRAHAITFVDMTGDGKENFVASLNSGTWYIDDKDWVRLTVSIAEAISCGDITRDGNKNFVASYPSGIWYIDDGEWVRITTSTARAITFADMTGDGMENFVVGLASGTWYLD